MKSKLLLLLALALLVGQADAQNFLQRVGRAVNAVKSHIPSQPASESDSDRNNSTPSQAATVVSRAAASGDRGENVKRQGGLDYIDEYGVNHGGGILIGGILWAPVNCGYHPTQYPYGKLYQWGRLHGQGYGAPYGRGGEVDPDPAASQPEIVPGPTTPAEARKHPKRFYAKSRMAPFNWCDNDLTLWCNFTDDGKIYKNKSNDPCPEGWRLPDLQDYNNLAQHYSEVVAHPETGQKGRWFSGPQPYSTAVQRIFLPLAGYRSCDGQSSGRDSEGLYWSLRHGGGEGLVWHLYINSSKPKSDPMAYPHDAYSVRCVKDVPGQRMY